MTLSVERLAPPATVAVVVVDPVAAVDVGQPTQHQCLFHADTANLGAGSVHSLSWADSVAGVAMALCLAAVLGGPIVFSWR